MSDINPQGVTLGTPAPVESSPQVPVSDPVATDQSNLEQPNQQGTDFVDFRNSPPEVVEARFKRIYGNLKEHERTLADLREHNLRLAQILQDQQTQAAAQSEQTQRQVLTQRLIQAKEAGNIQEEVRLTNELSTLSSRVAQPVNLPPPPPVPNSEANYVTGWTHEILPDGNFRRPWSFEGHPRYQDAYNITAALTQDPRYQGNVEAILSEVDRRMGVNQLSPRPPGAPLLSGQGAVRPEVVGEVALSPDEVEIARKFGLTPKAYAEQKKLLQTHGRAYSVPARSRNG